MPALPIMLVIIGRGGAATTWQVSIQVENALLPRLISHVSKGKPLGKHWPMAATGTGCPWLAGPSAAL